MLKDLILIMFIFIFLPNITAQADITSGLVAWWTLDDGIGTSAQDSSTASNNLMISYPYGSWVIGKVWEYAHTFAGNSSMSAGNVSTYSFIQNSKTFTMSTWVKLADYTANGDETIMEDSHGGHGSGFFLYYHNVSGSPNSLEFSLSGSMLKLVEIH